MNAGPSIAQGQTKKYVDSVDADSVHQQQQQRQQQQSTGSEQMDDRSILAGHYPGEAPSQQQQQQHNHTMRQQQHHETNFDIDGNVETETKSISSLKSSGSVQDGAMR